MPDFDLTITICSWNTIDDTRACLQSLRAARDEADFEVLVVDNASADGSADMIESEFPDVRLIRSDTNLMFVGGHNLGLKERRGRHAALLNSDTIVHKGAIAALVRFMAEHPESGIVGPKLLNPDGSLQFSCRRFPNPIAAAFRNTPLGRIFPNNRFTRDYLMTDWEHDTPREVDWLSGAAMFVRSEVLERIGGLDTQYRMYLAEVDWCKRAWDAGFKVTYLPEAVITHAIGRSTDQIANRMIVRFHREMLIYYRDHDLRRAFVLARPFLWLLAALALGVRAGMFLLKNLFDALRRSLS